MLTYQLANGCAVEDCFGDKEVTKEQKSTYKVYFKTILFKYITTKFYEFAISFNQYCLSSRPDMSRETILTKDLKLLISENSNTKQLSCNDCGRSYASMHNLKRNIRSQFAERNCQSSKRNINPCTICKESFLDSRLLKTHMNTHSEICPYICSICHKGFKKQFLLNYHLRTHITNDFNCAVCDTYLPSKHILKVHMRMHTNERPFTCPDCPYKGTQKSNLNTHLKRHIGEKPEVCKECKKQFSTVAYLKIHMLIHVGMKPFSCNSCDKSFTQKQHLNTHMLTHNGEETIQMQTLQ